MSASLVVLAAGMASRYGSLKQIDQFGPSGESIIDYSIYDAIEAGFTKIVFVIRQEFAKEFREIFESKLKDRVAVEFVFQELDSFTNGYAVPAHRTKPWGTGHAILCAKDLIHEPFAVINGDDFYGKEAFQKAYRFLLYEASNQVWANVCYSLSNTLSDYGFVSRGVRTIDENNFITGITERTKIYQLQDEIVYEENGSKFSLPMNTRVSMNFWCFTPDIFQFSQGLFEAFLNENGEESKSEFFIPSVASQFIRQEKGKIKAITTGSQWFGVTYQEDKPIVQKRITALLKDGIYPSALYHHAIAKIEY
jgi:UTP-glucose-1-phosphate uridylyltransferase